MKRILLTALYIIFFYNASAATYIYNPSGTGVVSVVGNWWTGVNGTGTQFAGSFNTSGNTFEIRNTSTIVSANWAVGTGSTVIVGNTGIAGITFTIPSNFTFTGTIDIVNASTGTNTLDITHTTIPTLGTLSNGSTVNYSANVAQTVQVKTYQNLTLSGSAAKTITGVTVNGKLSIQGTATASAAPTYGSAASLEYNSTSSITAGPEWISPFVATGGVIITNTGVVTLNGDRQMGSNTNVPLQVLSPATLNTSLSNYTLTLHGDLINTGNLTGNASPVIIGGTAATQSIAGFTTTGLISMTKPSGTATMTGNLPQSGTGSFPFTINSSLSPNTGAILFGGTSTFTTTGTLTVQNGTIQLNNLATTSSLTHMHQVGDFTIIGGTVDFSTVTTPVGINLTFGLNVSGNYSKTAGLLKSSSVNTTTNLGPFALIQFNGTTQTIKCTSVFSTNTHLTYYVTSGSTCTLSPTFDFNLGPAGNYESFDVRSGGTLICGATEAIKNAGPGFFTLNGTLKTANVNGIISIGQSSNTGTIGTVQTGSRRFFITGSLEYNGSANQVTGTFFTQNTPLSPTPTATPILNNLTINNIPKTTGVVTAQQDFTVNGVFAQSNGIFAIGGTATTPQTLTLNGTITNADDNYNRLRANGFSHVTIGNTGTGGSGPLGHQLFFDQTGKGESKGTGSADDLTVLTPGSTNNLRNFTMNRPSQTVILQNEMQVNNVVNITSGILASGGTGGGQSNLVMLSTATSTSSILELVSGASVTGDVVVQSFFKGGTVVSNRGFRMISSPTSNTATFFPQLKQRSIITCLGGVGAGCDFPPVLQPSAQTVQTYLEPGAAGSTSFGRINHLSTMEIGRGYYFFFRGNRSNLNATTAGKINMPFTAPEDWTNTYIGGINSGPVPVTVTKGTIGDGFDGINLVGNPYPATLDFAVFRAGNSAVPANAIDDYISMMKRNRTGFFTSSGGITNGINETTLGSGGATVTGILAFIQPGQGFFVRKTNVGSGTITFQESHKASSANSPGATRQLSVPERGLKGKRVLNNAPVRKLIRINLQDADTREDATIVLEDGNDANYGDHDAPHFSNANVSVASITSDGINTAINFMPDASEVDSIRLYVSGSTNPAIKLSVTDFTGAGNKELVLLDKYTKTSTVLNGQNNGYTFGVNRDVQASFGRDRFVLLFKKNTALSMDDRKLKAAVQNNGVLVSWTTVSESESKEFVVERSQDGQNFLAIGTKKAAGNSTGEIRYSFIDAEPLEGALYYRLRKVDMDGNMAYSNVANVIYDLQTQGFVSVYPNPVKGELNINWKTNEIVDIGIYDMAGKLVRTYNNLKGSDFKADVSSLTTGSYIIKIRNRKTGRELATNKFIKD